MSDRCENKNVDDFFQDWRTEPKNQPKYFFSDAITYYKQLCKMQKQIEDLKGRIGKVAKINGSDTITATASEDGSEYTISVKPEGIDIEDLENYDVLEGRVDDVEGHIEDIDDALETIEGDITTLQTGKQNKLTVNPTTTTSSLTGLTIDGTSYAIQGGGGVSSYNDLTNKPQVNSVELTGNKSLNDLGITKSAIGLGNVDNTSDTNKPISTATQNALNLKANQSTTYTKTETDSLLSDKADITDIPTNSDFTLAGLGEKNYNSLTNKPTIPSAPVVRSNIAVSGVPTEMASYELWDTENLYKYKLEVTVEGLTEYSMINNIVIDNTLLKSIAPVITTNTGKVVLYAKDNTSLLGYILTLITSEVVYG